MLEVAPAYLSDTDAADVLTLLCKQIGEPLEQGLAARHYAMPGDRRALHGTVLQATPPARVPGRLHVTVGTEANRRNSLTCWNVVSGAWASSEGVWSFPVSHGMPVCD
jgi:hypothetical protein